MRKQLLASLSIIALTACDLSPDYTLPDVTSNAPAFKEAADAPAATIAPAPDGAWKRSDEKAQIEETAWWRMFKDASLDKLEEQAMKDNPSLEVAQQRVVNAQAAAEAAGASLFPSVSIGAGPMRQKLSPASINASAPPGFNTTSTKPYTLYTAQGTISYELDLFGQTRNRTRAAEFDAAAEENNYRAARLSLQADVAQTYFQLAALRMEADILTKTIATRKDSLGLIHKKRDVGEIDDLQVSAAETDLANAQSDAAAVAQQIAVAEHGLAILIGAPPAQFTAAETKLTAPPPVVPAGIPSTLLERRPDIKAAVKSIAAANARIGVARAGYFPEISISAVGGFTSGELSNLFDWSNRTWLIGPLAGTVLTQPIFEGGRISAAIAQTDADYASSVAGYRASVLQAFREVEDQLSGLHHLSDQAASSATALHSSTRAYDIAAARYKVGYSSYLEYLDAQRSLLAAQRSDVQVMGSRYITTVQLVKALGGSWQAAPALTPVPIAEPVVTSPVALPEAATPVGATPAPVAPETTEPSKDAEPEAKEETAEPEWWEIWK